MSGVTRIAVVGAGLAGLSASTTVARLAKDAANRGSRHRPFQITLIDKSRSVGGRMATRRVYPGARAVGEPVADEHIAFDTGAQLLRVRDEEFQKLIGQWTDDGRVDEFGKGPPIVEDLAGFMADWKSGTVNGSAQPEKATDMGSESKSCRISGTVDSNVKYFWRGPGGMNAFVKKMADEAESLNVNIKLGSEVGQAELDGLLFAKFLIIHPPSRFRLTRLNTPSPKSPRSHLVPADRPKSLLFPNGRLPSNPPKPTRTRRHWTLISCSWQRL